jgi:SAM-dependent methyltransferase
MPEYFDAYSVSEDTNCKNVLIEKLLQAYGVKTVLDLTCGTGSQVFFLNNLGYGVVGADFSPALLEVARHKLQIINHIIYVIDDEFRHELQIKYRIKLYYILSVISRFNVQALIHKAK